MSDYTLDANAAKQADNINARIEQKGKYLGVITRAEPVTSKKGSRGVDLSFKADSGESADYLTLWTHNAEGKQIMGYNTLMAIMTCLRVRDLNAENGQIEKYDSATQKRAKVTVPIFKELMNKPVGLLLQMEEYEKSTGGSAWKPTIFAVFDKDEFTASEILNKSSRPEQLVKMVQAMRDKPLKAGSVPAPAHHQADAPKAGDSFADFENDIPF